MLHKEHTVLPLEKFMTVVQGNSCCVSHMKQIITVH